MTHHMNADEQSAVFNRHSAGLFSSDDAEYRTAAMAICSTATDHTTGWALACGLVGVMRGEMGAITELGQTPVTAAIPPQNAAEEQQLRATLAFVGTAVSSQKDAAYERYCEAEAAGPETLAYLYAFLTDTLRQLGHQYEQARTDWEATR